MGRTVHPLDRSVSWVNSVSRQFLANGPKSDSPVVRRFMWDISSLPVHHCYYILAIPVHWAPVIYQFLSCKFWTARLLIPRNLERLSLSWNQARSEWKLKGTNKPFHRECFYVTGIHFFSKSLVNLYPSALLSFPFLINLYSFGTLAHPSLLYYIPNVQTSSRRE